MFSEDGYKKLEFPCYLIETYQLERYLEAKAEQGKIFADFSYFGLSGKFEDAMPKKFHYCVDVYYRPLKKKELAAAEFEEYKATCLSCGWHYVCAFENIVVFYSDEEVRPPELQTDPELKQDILTRVTWKVERKRMIIRALSNLFMSVIFLINPLIILLQGDAGDWNRWDLVAFGMFFVWPLVFIWDLLKYRCLVKKLREGRLFTDEGRPWDRWSFTTSLFAILGLLMTIECFWFRMYMAGMRGILAMVFLLCALLLTKWRLKRNNSAAERWKMERPTGVETTILCCGLVLLLTMMSSLPVSGNY